MSIVSSRIIEDAAQKDGRRYLRYGHTDHNGKEHVTHVRLVAAAFVADAASDAPRQEQELSRLEAQNAISRVEDGEDPVDVINDAEHAISNQIAIALIYDMVRDRDPYKILTLESLFDFMRDTMTAVQIRSYLNITAVQFAWLNSRYNRIIAHKADIRAADVQEDW